MRTLFPDSSVSSADEAGLRVTEYRSSRFAELDAQIQAEAEGRQNRP